MVTDEFAPCRLVTHDNGRYSLCFDQFDSATDVFDEAGYDAGGYAWHGVVAAWVSYYAPKLKKKIAYDPEASLFVAYGKDLNALKQVAQFIRQALEDHELLREVLERADPDLMD